MMTTAGAATAGVGAATAAAVAAGARGGDYRDAPGPMGASASPSLLQQHAAPKHPAPSSVSSVSSLSAPSTLQSNLSVRLESVNAGALSVDATGGWGVLAGRRGLHVVDLEAPYAPLATLHHQTKWDVTVVKCNPHAAAAHHVASTSNHHTLIWDLTRATGHGSGSGGSLATSRSAPPPLVATLRAHARAVNDVAWSPADPAVLATCSADTRTHIWDLRAPPPRPALTLCAFTSSAVQVAWSAADPMALATAHEGEVRVWDLRGGGGGPAVLITAHMQKIYGLDWHPRRRHELVTCSEDKTVKFWHAAQPRVCQGTLPTGAPVWRARFTPFGDGLVTSSHRLDHVVRLWHVAYAPGADVSASASGAGSDPATAPATANTSVGATQVYAFSGHSDVVKAFGWRARPHQGFQLVSWAKDQELRLWRVDPQHLEACGFDPAVTMASASAAAGLQTTTTTPATTTAPRADDVTPYAYRSHPDEGHAMPPSSMVPMPMLTTFDLSMLKSDHVPLVVPPSAVPLGATEYALPSTITDGPGPPPILTFDDEPSKELEPQASSEDEDEDPDVGRAGGATTKQLSTTSTPAAAVAVVGQSACLPCPRISGGCFSGPNLLVVFDSRVAIGQTRAPTAPSVSPTLVAGATGASSGSAAAGGGAVSAAGGVKPGTAPSLRLPRTYAQLLEMRDSRFAKKKGKKQPPALKMFGSSHSLVGGGAMDLAGPVDWAMPSTASVAAPLTMTAAADFVESSGYTDDGDHSVHGYHRSGGMYFGGGGGDTGIGSAVAAGDGPGELAVHGGSEYLKMYFASAELHLPVNHPEHRISVPSIPANGAPLSPRASTIRANVPTDRAKRAEPASALLHHLDLSLSVTVLDLSRLCGVSSVLTYETRLAPSPATTTSGAAALGAHPEGPATTSTHHQLPLRRAPPTTLDAGSRDLYAWMLQAATSKRFQRRLAPPSPFLPSSMTETKPTTATTTTGAAMGAPPRHPLARILQSTLAAATETTTPTTATVATALRHVSDVCAHNARVAQLAGRADLEHVWSLLELSTAAATSHEPHAPQARLTTAHPWRAHPFGQGLVRKVLAMYEQSSDLPALASIVCALQPTDPATSAIENGASAAVNDAVGAVSGLNVADTISTVTATTTGPLHAGTTSPVPAKAPGTGTIGRSRTSFNGLSQLLGGSASEATSDLAPAMRSARRSSSHNEVPKLLQSGRDSPVLAAQRVSKDWPVPRGPRASATSAVANAAALSPRGSGAGGGWRTEFERLDNPMKTWSAGSHKDASPRPLSHDMFRPPTSVAPPSRGDGNARRPEDGEEVVGPSGRIFVEAREGPEDPSLLAAAEPREIARYDAYKAEYAELLYRYGALTLRNEVLKKATAGALTIVSTTGGTTTTATSPAVAAAAAAARGDEGSENECDEDEAHPARGPEGCSGQGGLTFGVLCRSCQMATDGLYCGSCREFAITCSICQLVVRGQSMYCLTCGHGGHAAHVRGWFETENACPTGCGCWCKQSTSMRAPNAFPELPTAAVASLALVGVERVPSRSYSF